MIQLDFAKGGGLIPAVAQDYRTGEVLMLAYVSPESWEETLKSGCATYYSRSRRALWKKGEQSGNVQRVKAILIDCDADAVVFKVEQIGGAACHTGRRSCFYRQLSGAQLVEVSPQVFDPEQVYRKVEK